MDYVLKNLNVCSQKGPLEVISSKSSAQPGSPAACCPEWVSKLLLRIRGWRFHILHEQAVAVLSAHHSEKAFLNVWRESSGLQFVPMASGPVTSPQRLSLLVTAKCFN